MSEGAPPAPPGWYQDPDEPGVLRYWDGSGWSTSPPTVPPPGVQVQTPIASEKRGQPRFARRLAEQPGAFWGAVIACVAMGVGAVGTWATALGIISIAGTTGEDGQVVLALAGVGLLCLWARALGGHAWPAAFAILCGAAGATIGGIDLHKLSGIGTTSFFGSQVRLVHAGWGIYLVVGAGTALALLTVAAVIIGPNDEDVSDEDSTGRYSAGTAFAVVAVAVGVVIAVSNVGTRNSVSAGEAAASTTTTEQPAESSSSATTAETTPSATTETSTTPASAPTSNSEPLEAVERYWTDIGNHDYSDAYSHLAPSSGISAAKFAEGEQQAGVQSAEFRGNTTENSGGTAKVEVVSLTTHDRQYGCRTWTGSYELSNQSGSWLIEKASITPSSCG